jgi:hypothetical protein
MVDYLNQLSPHRSEAYQLRIAGVSGVRYFAYVDGHIIDALLQLFHTSRLFFEVFFDGVVDGGSPLSNVE